MKRNQIRQMLSKSVTDAQLRRAISALELPTTDDTDYTDEQAKFIIDQFRPREDAKSDRHAATASAAHQSTVRDKATLANRTNQQLAGIQQSIGKIASDRTNAIEQVSDTLAYLYSPATFQSDVMNRTAEKLGLKAAEAKQEPTILTLDSLGDCFSRFADAVEYPAIAASSALGCLPM
jgi:hypothetical protein